MPCGDAVIRVDAADAATHEVICSAASYARDVLARCGLVPMAPVVIKPVDDLFEPVGRCLASFDCNLGEIRIIRPERLHESLLADDPYAAIPTDMVFRSLLTHELAHAVVYQRSGDYGIAPVDHEFIANALGLASLTEHYRQIFLDAVGVEPPVRSGGIDIFIYMLDPRRFAAASYLYFEAQGCEPIRGILDGTKTFRTKR